MNAEYLKAAFQETILCNKRGFSDPPTAPGVPRCVEADEESITITWAKPRHDGGSPITGYVIEKRLLTEDKWTKATHALVPDTVHK